MHFEERIKRARTEMKKQGIGMMYLMYGANLWYLVGIPRKQPELTDMNKYGDFVCGAYIGADGGCTLIAPRLGGEWYSRQAENKAWIDNVRLVDENEKPADVMADVAKKFKTRGRVALDDRAWMHTGLLFEEMLPNTSFVLSSEILAPMRMVKDADEIAAMEKAGEVTDEVYGEVVEFMKPGMTEFDIAHEIDYRFAKKGLEHPAFPSGVRFSRPGKPIKILSTNRASAARLQKGDAITFDIGAYYNGYCSDFGRTCFVGDPPPEFVKMHDIVLAGQEAGIKAMVNGKVTAAQLDAAARDVIAGAGYGDRFVHRLGHGVGINVHEPPSLRRDDQTLIVAGMVVAIETSIINHAGGHMCRIGDVMLMTENGGRSLTNFHKKISIIAG